MDNNTPQNPIMGFFSKIMSMIGNFFPQIQQFMASILPNIGSMFGGLFGGQQAQAAPAPAVTPTTTPPPPVVQPRTVPVNYVPPAPAPQAAPAPAPVQTLSYQTKDNDTQWLNPADYQGRIKIPDAIKQEAGAKGVYAMVTIKAGQHADGHPYAMGFHVFEKDGKQELIPFISGGSKKVDVPNFANSDAVESARNAPLPGLLTDSSGKVGDGIHAKRTITQYHDTASTEIIDGQPMNFKFFLEYDDGKKERDYIGAHNDFLFANEDASRPKGSQGCPVVRDEDVEKFKQQAARLGLKKGSTYYILDPQETVQPTQGVSVTANQPPLSTPSAPTPTPQKTK
ncbi:MAG: hypothetical protein EAY65_02370 [Alphaproteobacteria bacterium]|nr:MAG: hypothetical protein EAY65_02370 [Alphaproteobacteria bacterium]